MRVALALVLLATACKYDLDHATYNDAAGARLCKVSTNTQSCLDADAHSDFTFIQSTILKPKCTFSGCHDGGSLTHQSDFRTKDAAHAALVGVTSMLDSSRTLVVPGDVNQSFLTVMLGTIKLDEAVPPLQAIPLDSSGNKVGLMPKDSTIICCQKLDAISRWIAAGAAND